MINNTPLFATIGHQESWEKVAAVLNTLRSTHLRRLSLDEVKEIVPWIPPRPVVRIRIRSYPRQIEVGGIHIETFIAPEKLTPGSVRQNIERVRAAAECAVRERVRLAALGGFTSIVLEGDASMIASDSHVVFTTGNTLTTAYITKGLEAASSLSGLTLNDCRLLVVGSTGDIGSACVRYFSGKVRSLLLCARNRSRLEKQREQVRCKDGHVEASADVNDLVPSADLIILAASTGAHGLRLEGIQPHAVVCDAGYPKNVLNEVDDHLAARLFSGGMGHVRGGFDFAPDLRTAFYDFPVKHVAHGCALESALLALEGRFEPYSIGRGNISVHAIEEIWAIAQAHGFTRSPFFNSRGLWENQNSLDTKHASP